MSTITKYLIYLHYAIFTTNIFFLRSPLTPLGGVDGGIELAERRRSSRRNGKNRSFIYKKEKKVIAPASHPWEDLLKVRREISRARRPLICVRHAPSATCLLLSLVSLDTIFSFFSFKFSTPLRDARFIVSFVFQIFLVFVLFLRVTLRHLSPISQI